METIECRLLPETSTKPRRVKAWCEDYYVTISVEGLTVNEGYLRAAKPVKEKFGWTLPMIGEAYEKRYGICV